MTTILTALFLLVLPIAVGWAAGSLIDRLLGRRVAGVALAAALLLVPPAIAVLLTSYLPLVGLWDAVTEGGLFGLGLMLRGHRWFEQRYGVALAAASLMVSLIGLEFGTRALLGAPPRFSTSEAPNLLLANALRANATTQGWDLGSNDVVCSAVYGTRHRRALNLADDADLVLPHR